MDFLVCAAVSSCIVIAKFVERWSFDVGSYERSPPLWCCYETGRFLKP